LVALGKGPGHTIKLFPRLHGLIRDRQPAIVHTRNLAALEVTVPTSFARVPVRIHGEHGRDVGDLDGKRRGYRLVRRLYRPFVTRYVAVSRDLERYLTGPVGIESRRVEQIYNGVDTVCFTPCAAGRPPIEGSPFNDPDPRGRRCPAPRLARRRACGRAMRGLDRFVLPSLAEGISNTILEAMASGLPVIATRVGGNAELMEPGLTGSLVPAADADALAREVLAYFADPVLARRHGRAGRNLVERRFSLDRMVEQYHDLYSRALAGERAGVRSHAAAGKG
jgi:glycosyltransferase involved in cell wall biosynthesis